MKRYIRSLVALIVILGISGGNVSAEQEPCDNGQITISNTGPDSTNIVDCVTVSDVTVTCNNSIYVLTESSQTAISGAAGSGVNTSSGSVISGNATNENGATVQIGAACETPAVVVPETPVTPVTRTTPVPTTGTGATSAVPVATVLPNTASNSVVQMGTIGLVTLATIAGASAAAVGVYRRLALK